MLRRLSVCLAFATWCFLNTWVELAEGRGAYFARFDPLDTVVAPTVCWEIVLALAMFGVWELCLRLQMKHTLPVHALFLACCFAPLGIASIAAVSLAPVDLTAIIRQPLFWPVVILAAIAPLGLAVRRPPAASRFMREMVRYSWPVLAIVLIQAFRETSLRYRHDDYADGPRAAEFPSQPPIRVVWVIFDELSQAIAFDNRPAGLALPNLDRLRAESFYATCARSPGDFTEISMPSLILGEAVIEAKPKGPRNLLLRTRSRPEPFTWSSVPNVFETARKSGFNTALVGWFHPYGRLLNYSLTKCYWTAGWLVSGIEEPTEPLSLAPALIDRGRLQLAALPLVGHLPGVHPEIRPREEKRKRYTYLMERALEIAADPAAGLSLIHLPIPHPPAIYNRSIGAITAEGETGYLDSVVLADRALGELRRSIEHAGLWNRTALLVSADDGWRTSIWRGVPGWTREEEAVSHGDTVGVPFLLKLPGETSGLSYSKAFDTLITRRIITHILEARLTDAAGIAAMIENGAL